MRRRAVTIGLGATTVLGLLVFGLVSEISAPAAPVHADSDLDPVGSFPISKPVVVTTGAKGELVVSDPVPAGLRELIARQPTLATRLAAALDDDPEGWTVEYHVAHWRGGASLWVGNDSRAVGDFFKEYGTPDWPMADHHFDADRALVWAAWERWRAHQADLHNAAMFASVGTAPVVPAWASPAMGKP